MEELSGFAKLDAVRKSGSELFQLNNQVLDIRLIDFWRWSASDLVSNATRGILAEYIVACALGLAESVRSAWDAYDLRTLDGIRVEVKSAAYLQSWYHKELSKIQFSIRPTRKWDAATNEMDNDLKRQGDVYVFCVLNHQDKSSVDPLNLNQWDFYVLSASTLNEKCPTQKMLSLSSLKKFNPLQPKFEEIANCVQIAAKS